MTVDREKTKNFLIVNNISWISLVQLSYVYRRGFNKFLF